jgi:hypothetical protein
MAISRTLVAAILTTLSLGAVGCKDDQLKGAQAEVQKSQIKVTVPTVPAFEVPPVNPDGSHTVKELRVLGRKYLKQEIMVKGIVVWAYDCVTAVRQGTEDEAATRARIEADPTICRRPTFYLGDTADTQVEKAKAIVEIPRPPTTAEKKNLPKEEIKNWPAVPPYKVGDEVLVTGQWVITSPHGETDTDGLLVYKSMKNITQSWESPPLDPNAIAPATIQAPPH